MDTSLGQALGGLASRAFTLSAVLFLLLNGAAIALFTVTRDRHLVNRWTSKLLAADLVLLGTGLGVPALACGARLVVSLIAGATTGVFHVSHPH